MSLRSKTQKAKKFGTPTETTAPAPKAPSPKKPKIVRTATGGVVSVSTPKAPRTAPRTDFGYGVTPTAAGIAVQEQFKSQIQTLTAPIRNTITALQQRLASEAHQGARLQGYAYEVHLEDQKKLEELIHQKEADIIEVELDANVKQIIEAIESGQCLYL